MVLTGSLCCVLGAGCGGSGHSSSVSRLQVAVRVCQAARDATARLANQAVALRITSRNPDSVACVVHAGTARLQIVAQASAQAWTEYDTTTSHQSQVYGPGVHEPGQIPQQVTGVGAVAVWIPAQKELVTTNGTPTRGGNYVTVTVKGRAKDGPTPLALARSAAVATLATAPRGPNPGSS